MPDSMTVRESVNAWKGVLGRLKNFRSPVERDWRINLKQYSTKIHLDVLGDIQIKVNQAFGDVKIMLRAATSGKPYIYIRPTAAVWKENAGLLQVLVNDGWRTQMRRKALRAIALDTILMKKGFGLSHFKIDRLTGRQGAWLTRVSPWNIYVDDGANSVDEAHFWFRRVLLAHKDAVKRWPKAREYLKPVGLHDVRPHKASHFSTSAADYSGFISSKALDDLMGRVVVWELHNQLDGEIATFAETYDYWLDIPRRSPYPRGAGSLLTELEFNEIPDEQFGIGDLEPVRGQSEEMDRVRSEQYVHIRRFRRRYRSQKNNLDKDAKIALESGEDGVLVEMADADNTAFGVIEDARISPDLHIYEGNLKEDRRETLGINEYLKSGNVPGTKTKYEAQQIMSGSAIRANEKSEMTEMFVENVTRKDIAIQQTFYDAPMVAQIAGPEGYKWIEFQPSDIGGVHEVEIHVGSMAPKDNEAEFMKGEFLYKTLKDDPMINHVVLLDRVLDKWEVPNRHELIGQQGTQHGPGAAQMGLNPGMAVNPQLQQGLRSMGQRGGGGMAPRIQ